MQKYYLQILLLFVLNMSKAQEVDSTFYQVKLTEFSAQSVQIENYQNPVFVRDFGNFKYSEIKAEYTRENKETYLVQTPENQMSLALKAKTFSSLNNKTTLWGEASYQNGISKNQVENETLDYEIIYPYFSADSVGGDFKKETYAFSGGISSRIKKMKWGASLQYQAQLASRDQDPRTRNISSDLNVVSGAVYQYLNIDFGLSAGFSKYNQSNDIDFYSTLGNPNVYHLNGLGNYNALFDGSNLTSYYDGWGYNAGLQIVKTNKSFSLQGQFKNQKIDKIIDHNISTIASTLNREQWQFVLTKLFSIKKSKWGFKLLYSSDSRTGTEPLFSTLSAQTADVIGYYDKFTLDENKYEMRLIYISDLDKIKLKIQPFFNVENYKENYTNPANYQNFDNLNFGLEIDYLAFFKNKQSLWISPQIQSHINSSSSSLFNSNEDFIQSFLDSNFAVLSQNYTSIKLQTAYTLPLRSANIMLDAKAQNVLYSEGNNWLYSFGVGILF